MFYDQPSIDFLIDRVGWADAMQPTTLTISSQNLTSTSGRLFNSFNGMVIVENVWDTIVNEDADNQELNDVLYSLKKQSVLDVLSHVFDVNPKASLSYGTNEYPIDISNRDYSATIQGRNGLFDAAIGYTCAIKSIELILSSNRANGTERGNKFNWQTLKAELSGLKDEYGRQSNEGLESMKNREIQRIIKILWPDGGYPKLIGRSDLW